MCGADGAVCLHGDCMVEALDGEAFEHCRCYAMYSGSQCSFRSELLYWELPVAVVLMLVLLVFGILVTAKTIKFLRFPMAKKDEFAFPRKYESARGQSAIARLVRGKWGGPTRKGLPTKPAKGHLMENTFITIVVFMEIVPWVQLTALSFLPVVPWPASSRGVAETLRLSLVFPLWSHFEASQFPKLMLYISLGFVPGAIVTACVVGAKRFPLFKPQPKNTPAEDLCTLVLRLYSDWIALPVLIGLLLPLECVVIGYSKVEGTGRTLPNLDGSCFTLFQGGFAAAGIVMLLVFCVASSVIVVQLNCEGSPPEPTLWTHVRYTRTAQVLKAPVAMSVVASVNANAMLVCGSSLLTSLILGVMNARMKPCVHSLVNGLRLAGSVMSVWSSLLALTTALVDDPGVTLVYEAWSLGAIAISVVTFSGLLLYHTEEFWHQLATTTREAGTASTKDSKGGKTAGSAAPATVSTEQVATGKQTSKVAAVGFRGGLPRLLPRRRSSVAEKLRSRAKHGQAAMN